MRFTKCQKAGSLKSRKETTMFYTDNSGFSISEMLQLSTLPKRMELEMQALELKLKGQEKLNDLQQAALASIGSSDIDKKRLKEIKDNKDAPESMRNRAQEALNMMDSEDLESIIKRHNLKL